MSELKFHIAREGMELGMLSDGDAGELLAAGFLRPDDEFWTDLDPTRRPLRELLQPAPGKDTSWLVRARNSAIAAGGAIREQATGVAEKISSLARRNTAAVAVATDRMLEDYLPTLRHQVARNLQKSVHTTKSAVKDEAFMRKLFGAMYDCLPKAVYRFVNEEAFIQFCLKHQRKLLD
jgi:hypothetical protein